MNRRAFLASVAGGATVLAGCITTGDSSGTQTTSPKTSAATPEPDTSADMTTESSRIAAEVIRASPGDTGTVVITAKGVTKMTVSLSLNDPLSLDYENATFSPQIRSVAESFPPKWHWSSPQQQVTVRVPFRVPADTQSGNYNYSVTVSNESTSYPDSVTEESTITVA